ncbi:hypothetical protein E1B28_007018 [Marasmius oreades]|uniref:Uncharacterized protein n=1 Tax=Marasmius oreades TaxID=181124 RepID=A0A9P7S1C9_9AGAR|nr:uncharacterized protein E1B28_007018 [Marasmius oreades]KAG7093338.1 hypothetical protein E1B28_007018 [Marasmius oreades]
MNNRNSMALVPRANILQRLLKLDAVRSSHYLPLANHSRRNPSLHSLSLKLLTLVVFVFGDPISEVVVSESWNYSFSRLHLCFLSWEELSPMEAFQLLKPVRRLAEESTSDWRKTRK